jgi:hypothetical protein
VSFEDLNGLFPRLQRLADAITPKNVVGEFSKIAVNINALQKQLVAKDTWTLHDSIRTVVEVDGVTLYAGGGGFYNPKTGKEVDYGAYQEYGTSVMAAHPYFYPGYEVWTEDLKAVPINLIIRSR